MDIVGVTEAGKSIVALHFILLFNILESLFFFRAWVVKYFQDFYSSSQNAQFDILVHVHVLILTNSMNCYWPAESYFTSFFKPTQSTI